MNYNFDDPQTAVKCVGLLFLLAMAFAIAGNLNFMGLISGDDYLASISKNQSRVGFVGVFMLLNSFSVLGIGILAYAVLSQFSRTTALTYLVTRIFESVVLAVGLVAILNLGFLGDKLTGIEVEETRFLYLMADSAISINWFSYHTAMAALGFGSLPFCLLLWRQRFAPRALTALGFVGYAALGANSLASILGRDFGIAVTLPVFLFEIAFGCRWLIRGVGNDQSSSPSMGRD